MTTTLISTAKAAELLGIRPVTLRAWHLKQIGPAPIKIANRLLYDQGEVEKYATTRTA